MFPFQFYLLLFIILPSQTSTIIFLGNCTYSIDLYKQYLNLLWSSNDSRTLHIQAVYSYLSNQSFIPGHIYTYSSQNLALIPLFIRCTYPEEIRSRTYLPLTQCSSTISSFSSKKNYESTRTYLNRRNIRGLNEVPLLYTGEYDLLLFNCSFQWNSYLYQFQAKDLFTFRIEYERAINEPCQSCNRRTSICQENLCICRSGTLPMRLYQTKQFCVDTTINCSLDAQRCLHAVSMQNWNSHMNRWIVIIIILFALLLLGFLLIIWCLCRRTSTHTFNKQHEISSDQSIYMIHRHERTPSTISRTNSTKLSDCQPMDPSIFANEYVSTNYEDYPKIISDQNNGEVVLILA